MHTARPHGQVDDVSLNLLHELMDDGSPTSGAYEVHVLRHRQLRISDQAPRDSPLEEL